MDVVVRPAAFADLPAIRQLYRAFLHDGPARSYPVMDGDELDALVRALAAQFLAPTPLFCLLGAWAGERPIGFLGVEVGERAVGRPHRVANAHWLYVVPDSRGLGIARRLIGAGLEWLGAHHPDLTQAEWFAAVGDPQWTRRGFVPFLTRYTAPLALIAQAPAPEPQPEPLAPIEALAVNGSPGNGRRVKPRRRKRREEAPRRSDAE